MPDSAPARPAPAIDSFAPIVHADGVYINMEMDEYLRDPAICELALGGHAVARLAASPVDWRWERDDNPLWRRPEPSTLRARILGNALHGAVLEGIGAYEERFAVAPERAAHPHALATAADMKAWLAERGLKVSGSKDELVARIRAAPGETPVFWDEFEASLIAGRDVVSAEEDRYLRLAHTFTCEAYADLLGLPDAGLSEVSIFWSQGKRRFKARLDRMTAAGVRDLKKFVRAPPVDMSLRTHLVRQARAWCYHVQAVMHMRAANAVIARFGKDGFGAWSRKPDVAEAQFKTAHDIVAAWRKTAPDFHWLFVRCPGPPQAKPLPLRPGSALWGHAESLIARGLSNFDAFHKRWGDGLWFDAQGPEEIDDDVDVRPWMLGEAVEEMA